MSKRRPAAAAAIINRIFADVAALDLDGLVQLVGQLLDAARPTDLLIDEAKARILRVTIIQAPPPPPKMSIEEEFAANPVGFLMGVLERSLLAAKKTTAGTLAGAAYVMQAEVRRREPRHGPQRKPEVIARVKELRSKKDTKGHPWSHQRIANNLNAEGYHTERGSQWGRRSVGQLLASLGKN